MAFKTGPAIPGAQLYEATVITPQLTAGVTTADAGGSAVAATFMGQSAADQPVTVDYRIFFVYWDKAWTGGDITITPVINGTPQASLAFVISAQGAAGYSYKVVAPGTAAVGHGDTSGFTVTCAAGFTCSGTLSVQALFYGATTVQPNKTAWTPS